MLSRGVVAVAVVSSAAAVAAAVALALWLHRRRSGPVQETECRRCRECGSAKSRQGFSLTQWNKPDGASRTCAACRASSTSAQQPPDGSGAVAGTQTSGRRKLPRRRGEDAEMTEVGRAPVSPQSEVVLGRLTVIITTSPVQSNPSTDMFEALMESFDLVPGLTTCNKIIVCDGVRQGDVNKFRSGLVTPDAQCDYDRYVTALGDLARRGDGAFANTVVVKLAQRGGFGLAVKAALTRYGSPCATRTWNLLDFASSRGRGWVCTHVHVLISPELHCMLIQYMCLLLILVSLSSTRFFLLAHRAQPVTHTRAY
jgi:hypothetical protein